MKITLDGDRDTHNRMRPLRGGQGTFDRIIENIRRVAGKVAVAIGGNFDESSVDSYPALLEFLKQQDFADKLVKVNFKPVVRNGDPGSPVAGSDEERHPVAHAGGRRRRAGQAAERHVHDVGGRRQRRLVLRLVPVSSTTR